MSGDTLKMALEANRKHIEAGIRDAEAELRACEERCTELRLLIDRGKAALGGSAATSGTPRTLNDAMKLVLRERNGGPMLAPAILAEVRSRGLYRTRSGAPVSLNQIHARVYHAPETFERTPVGIQLRPG